MNRTIRHILTAAILSVPVMAGIADAQQRIDRSGALDANNRIGSGGKNQVDTGPKPWEIANDIALGNITGGQAFRGSLTRDPNQFHGNLGNTQSNRFVRDTSGISTNGTPTYNASRAQPFYGSNQLVPPPMGYSQLGSLGVYVPPSTIRNNPIDPRIGPIGSQQLTPARPGQFLMPGPVNSMVGPTTDLSPAPSNDVWSLSNFTQLNRATRTGTVDQDALDQIRKDLSAGEGDKTAEPRPGSFDDQMNSPTFENTIGSNVVGNGSAVSNTLSDESVNVGTRQRLLTPARQSTVYAALQKRREEQEKAFQSLPGQANADAAAAFNAQLQAQQRKAANNGNKPITAGGGGGAAGNGAGNTGGTTPGITPTNPTPPTTIAKPAPVRVDTLKGSDTSAALSKMLGDAETLTRQGKYSSSIDLYDKALREAPNNKLIELGKANAELGGQYYRRAEASLRHAMGTDKNLLAGQYDLKKFLGEERLAVIEQDLRDQVNKKDKEVGPAVLLAYLYYNTGNERRAAALLDLADQRAQGQDMFVKTLQQNWSLNPDDTKPADKPLDNK